MPAPKISLDTLTRYFNSRNVREKTMIVALGLCAALAADMLLIVRPAVRSLFKTHPELRALEQESRELEEDRKNESKVKWQRETLNERLEGMDDRFAPSSETAAEALSRLAQESGVKISSLAPSAKPGGEETRAPFAPILIKIQATSGAHALGRFLTGVENSRLFFRVERLVIGENPADIRNHPVEISVECYRKV